VGGLLGKAVDDGLGIGTGGLHEEGVLATRATHARPARRQAGLIELEARIAALATDDHAGHPSGGSQASSAPAC